MMVLRDVDVGTRSLIRYLAPQLELESYLGPAMMGMLAERPGGWDGGSQNDDGGGNGDCNANAMDKYQNWVAYEEDNTLRPCDEESAAQLLIAIAIYYLLFNTTLTDYT